MNKQTALFFLTVIVKTAANGTESLYWQAPSSINITFYYFSTDLLGPCSPNLLCSIHIKLEYSSLFVCDSYLSCNKNRAELSVKCGCFTDGTGAEFFKIILHQFRQIAISQVCLIYCHNVIVKNQPSVSLSLYQYQ